MLGQGDQTEIGERGINLSGGQKARVSLARAMYRARRFDFVVLDPLSALDVHVANRVFLDGIDGIAQDKTRVLVLNSHYHLLRFAHRILVMSDGKIVGDGSLAELERDLSFLLTPPTNKASDVSNDESIDPSAKEPVFDGSKVADIEKVSSRKLVTQEERRIGSVRIQTYLDYLSASEWDGRVLCGAIVALFTVAQAALFFCDWFLSQWSRGSVNLSQMSSLGVYAGIVVIASLLVFARCLFFIRTFMTCSIKIHLKYLRKVLAAPIPTFFDVTPIGRILNRFSRDLDEVDNPLPYWGMWLLLCVFQVASSFIVCAALNPFVLLVYLPVGYGCWFAAKVYLSSALELKRLDSVTRSPFLNLVSETIAGLDTVRSYNMTGAFAKRCEELLDNNIKFNFITQVASRWFDMRTDWFVSAILCSVALLAVANKSTMGAAAARLSLTYAAQLSSSFQRMTTLSTRVESIMTCFERIAHYGSLDEEGDECAPTSKDALSPEWPRCGSIVFENVTLQYRRDLPIVLKIVSFSVKSGEKIGICGRTGSGKSSLMSVLFRVVEIPNSSRVLIDNVDISTITLSQLRSKLSIIPRDPMLFSGSLRLNLNPHADKSDTELWEALRKVHLHGSVSTWGKGLDFEVAEKGDNLSVGQRQLLCIARALIRDSKVIVMDEATANVDQESDKVIQQTMRERFGGGGQTVLCIAHRIDTIMDSDKIVVLDAGEVVEFDTPSALLQIRNGHFRHRLLVLPRPLSSSRPAVDHKKKT
ncbi:ABC transporter [Phytophthora infestans]|uniref:ABC transporter n=1 Tax=Phytophthora infestans TaxID=4787 RepID=A0A8S9VG37_PHYIN|nr:ABC transporter [Phytophthora infestans]